MEGSIDIERILVAKAAHSGQTEALLSKGIEPFHFADPECRKIWEFLVDHTQKYKSPPSFAVIQERFPHHNFELVVDSLEFVTERFIGHSKRWLTIEALREVAQACDETDPDRWRDIDTLFLEKARTLALSVPTPEVGLFSEMPSRVEKYKRNKLARSVEKGIPFGIPTLDSLVPTGIQPHEYVSIVGFLGIGKSTLMQLLFFNSYMVGKTGLMFSLEMEKDALYRRWDTMALNFNYRDLKMMNLSAQDLSRWEDWAKQAKDMQNNIIVLDDFGGRCTIDKIYAETVRYKPDFVGIDYLSLMYTREGQQLWEKVTYLTQSLKQMTRSLKIPIICAAQLNRSAANEEPEIDKIAHSISVPQDSDIVIGVHQTPQMKDNQRMKVKLMKNRDGMVGSLEMHWDPEKMRFHEANMVDLFKRKGDEIGHAITGKITDDVANAQESASVTSIEEARKL